MAQCEATAKSTGDRCKKDAIPGTNVCHVHGGNAPQVRQKARERLDRMADDTTADMQDAIDDLFGQLSAIEDPELKVKFMSELRQQWLAILDRTGHGPEHTQNLESDTLTGIAPAFVNDESDSDG